MFGRKKADEPKTGETAVGVSEVPVQNRAAEPAADGTASGGHPLRQNLKPAVPHRVVEIPGAAKAPLPAGGLRAPGAMQQSIAKEAATVATPDPKTLIVGRDISLSGDITACDKLIVEGRIEANLKDSRFVEIAESGLFKGQADIDEADISGTFDGTLKVQGRLIIRATGSVKGEVEYGELEIECGGQIQGTIKAPVSAAAPVSIAAKA